MIALYLVLVELGKVRFYRVGPNGPPVAPRRPGRELWTPPRAARGSLPGPPRRSRPPTNPSRPSSPGHGSH